MGSGQPTVERGSYVAQIDKKHDDPVRRGGIDTVHGARMRRSERMLLPARAGRQLPA